jgi:glutamyl-tRNA reductase
VVVCATKDEEPVLGKSLAQTIETSCLLFDLGMPRNIDPSVGTFQRASLFDLEQLQNFMKTEYQVPQMVQEGYLRAAYSIAKRYHERFAEREQISLLRAQEFV